MEKGNFTVGVFDSGLGGLSVLAACMRRLPDAKFCYLGDNEHAPYGALPEHAVRSLVLRGVKRLTEYGADAVVLACNTATAVCIEEIRRTFQVPVVGVEPAVKPAALRYLRVQVLATPLTARSARLARLISRFPEREFIVTPLPHLAAAIEEALPYGKRVDLQKELPPARGDCIVLGCTHYALLRREIAAFYGQEVFDGAEGTAERLADVLGMGNENHLRTLCNHERPRENLFGYHKKRVVFLGNSAKLNEVTYFTNICFQ